ncbi:MAG: hypothetical protein ABDK94_10950, partial [Atribacterota bacterium]
VGILPLALHSDKNPKNTGRGGQAFPELPFPFLRNGPARKKEYTLKGKSGKSTSIFSATTFSPRPKLLFSLSINQSRKRNYRKNFLIAEVGRTNFH